MPSEKEAEELAKEFHETYERLAPSFGYQTRQDSAVPWDKVPEKNRSLMIAVCAEILEHRPSPPSSPKVDERPRVEGLPSGYAMPDLKAMSPYSERDTDELGEFYFRHVEAMTKYQLHDKSAIAAELAYRDWVLAAQARALASAERDLVQCAVISGEDEAGQQAQYAVQAVTELRKDYDEACDEVQRILTEKSKLLAERDRLTRENAELVKRNKELDDRICTYIKATEIDEDDEAGDAP